MEAKSSSSSQPGLQKKPLTLWRAYVNSVRELFELLSEWSTPATIWLGLILPSIFINVLLIAFPLAALKTYDDRVHPADQFTHWHF